MPHIRISPTSILLGLLAVLAGLPVRGQSDEQQLGQHERELIEQWRKSSKEFENLKVGNNDLATEEQIKEWLAKDKARGELGSAKAEADTEIPNTSELLERWRKG